MLPRWKHRPEGSTWGDFGPDDACGRTNLLTPERVRAAVARVCEGRTFCLSLPRDSPGGNRLNPRRHPPRLFAGIVGALARDPAERIAAQGWRAVMALNLDAVFNLTVAAWPYLAAARGVVVDMSLSLVERGAVAMAHSIATRAAVPGMTRSMAPECAHDGIRFSCIGPGTVLTPAPSGEAEDGRLPRLIQTTPMGRATRPRRWPS